MFEFQDLMNEKIKTQELHNEREKIYQNLEKIGIKRDQLITGSRKQDNDDR